MNLESYGQRVRELRNKLGLSQRAFSELIGVTQSRLSLLEGGKGDSGVSVAMRILEARSDISSDWLLLGQGAMYRAEHNQLPDPGHASSHLKDLESSASFSPQPEFWETYRGIYESPKGLTLEELPGDPRTAARRVRVLEGDGLIAEVDGRWVAQEGILWAKSPLDMAALSLRVAESLVDITRLARERPAQGAARLIIAKTAEPEQLRSDVIQLVEERLKAETPNDSGEVMVALAIRCDMLPDGAE